MKWQIAAFAAAALQVGVTAHDGGVLAVRALAPAAIEGIGRAPATVQAGTDVLINWELIKRTDCPGVNSRVWQGKDGFFLRVPLGSTGLPKTDVPVVYPIQTRIPDDAPPGDLRLLIEGVYTCPGAEPRPFRLGPVTMTVVE